MCDLFGVSIASRYCYKSYYVFDIHKCTTIMYMDIITYLNNGQSFCVFCIVAWGNSIERLIVCWVIIAGIVWTAWSNSSLSQIYSNENNWGRIRFSCRIILQLHLWGTCSSSVIWSGFLFTLMLNEKEIYYVIHTFVSNVYKYGGQLVGAFSIRRSVLICLRGTCFRYTMEARLMVLLLLWKFNVLICVM